MSQSYNLKDLKECDFFIDAFPYRLTHNIDSTRDLIRSKK